MLAEGLAEEVGVWLAEVAAELFTLVLLVVLVVAGVAVEEAGREVEFVGDLAVVVLGVVVAGRAVFVVAGRAVFVVAGRAVLVVAGRVVLVAAGRAVLVEGRAALCCAFW